MGTLTSTTNTTDTNTMRTAIICAFTLAIIVTVIDGVHGRRRDLVKGRGGLNPRERGEGMRTQMRRGRKLERQSIVVKGNDCEFIYLADITSNSGCSNGQKFVLKGANNTRKQFLIVNDKAIIAFITKRKKFTACESFTDITTSVSCKTVSGLDNVTLPSSSSSNSSSNSTAATTAAASNATTAAPAASNTTAAATTAASNATTASNSSGSSNTAAYCAIDSQHTMCLHTGPSDVCTGKTILRGMTESGKAAILAKHNALRRRVAKGEESGQPAAADMRELVWDDELEQIAQRWADQCTFEHDNVRTMLDGTRVGQNLYQSFSSAETDQDGLDAAIDSTVQAWYDEVGDFSSANINPFVSASGPATGHYTQVVWAETDKLGCANVYFNEASQPSFPYTNLVVCNYAIGGNLIGGSMYSEGTACSSCPSSTSCVDSLCQAA